MGSSFFAEELGELWGMTSGAGFVLSLRTCPVVCVTGAKGLRAQLEESRGTPGKASGSVWKKIPTLSSDAAT